MNQIGILKKFDKLGRIVIPKDMRDRYRLNEEVEIIAVEEGILLKNTAYFLTKRDTSSNPDS